MVPRQRRNPQTELTTEDMSVLSLLATRMSCKKDKKTSCYVEFSTARTFTLDDSTWNSAAQKKTEVLK